MSWLTVILIDGSVIGLGVAAYQYVARSSASNRVAGLSSSLLVTCLLCLAGAARAQDTAAKTAAVRKAQASRMGAVLSKGTPSPEQVLSAMRGVTFDEKAVTTGEIGGKKIRIIQTTSNSTPIGKGSIVARLETDAAGDETKLPPGNYDIFLMFDGRWRAFATANGKVVAEAAKVTVIDEPFVASKAFNAKGWSVSIKCRGGWRTCRIRIAW